MPTVFDPPVFHAASLTPARAMARGRRATSRRLAPMQVRNILVPTDLSPMSLEAVRYGAHLAQIFCAKLTLLAVLPELHVPYDFGDPNGVILKYASEEKNLLEQISALGDRVNAEEQVETETAVCRGITHKCIVDMARELEADMIVLSAHGRTGLRRWFPCGRTAEHIVHDAPCPVVVLHAGETHDFASHDRAMAGWGHARFSRRQNSRPVRRPAVAA